MLTPPFPDDEAQRLKALQDLLILDTLPEARFDGVTAYCQARFKVGMALITLVDAVRQWFKASAGLKVGETPRSVSFCGHAILKPEPLIVADARQDARFSDNPLVTGPPLIRFYAGAPLVISGGFRIGTLCLIDPSPRELSSSEAAHLVTLARAVSADLERQPGPTARSGFCPLEALTTQPRAFPLSWRT